MFVCQQNINGQNSIIFLYKNDFDSNLDHSYNLFFHWVNREKLISFLRVKAACNLWYRYFLSVF